MEKIWSPDSSSWQSQFRSPWDTRRSRDCRQYTGVLKIGAEGKLPDLGENITVWGNETADESRSGSKKGLDLTGYLRMFLFVSYGSEPLFRMMDMMQMNIKKEQPDFLLEKCVCMVDAEAGFCGKPVFFSSGPWKTLRKTRFSVSGNYFTKP